jgi:hypothetical protein
LVTTILPYPKEKLDIGHWISVLETITNVTPIALKVTLVTVLKFVPRIVKVPAPNALVSERLVIVGGVDGGVEPMVTH